jgi:hypothetical protein
MDSMVRKAALRLARKVAFGASFSVGALGACGDRVALEPDRPGVIHETTLDATAADSQIVSEPNAPVRGRSDSPAADAAPGADAQTLACGGPVELARPPSPPPGVSREQFECCRAYARSAAQEPMAFERDPSALNCCKVLIAGVDGQPGWDFYDSPRDLCCFRDIVAPAVELYPHRLCAPWGPPVPPAMTERLEVA